MGERYKSYGMKGKKHSEETRKKMSERLKKNPVNYWLGKKMPKKLREKMVLLRKSEYEAGRKPWNLGLRGWNAAEKNPMWKGGISPIGARIRNSLEMKAWRKSVFQRDNYTCVWCGARSGEGKPVILNADHIKPFSLFPGLRFDVNNGRTLCVPCHEKTDTYKGKLKKCVSS